MSEYEHSENKLSLGESKEAIESLAAFATAKGGTVYFGIGPAGERKGVQLGRNTLENLANEIKRNTNPPQFPSITVEGAEASAVVAVSVEESPIKPVWAYGRPKKRVGRTNQTLSPEETQKLMEQTRGRSWDALPQAGFQVGDIDRSLIVEFLRRAEQEGDVGTESVLQNLGLVTPEGPTRGAALLFAKNPQRFLPEAQVKCARFQGETSVKFLDQQTFEGSVLTQLDRALAFVARNTRQAIHITGRAERETVPEYPAEAIREAIANSICHRDYGMSGTVQVRIYDNRLEVWNPGMLPPELTTESLYGEHPSRPRNPNLAGALYRARVIEKWGTGTLRIVQACEARGLPRPQFLSEMGTFMVRFRNPRPSAVDDLLPPPVAEALNSRQRQAVARVLETGRITRSEYEILTLSSERQAVRDLNDLVVRQVFVRLGKSSSIYYSLHPPEGSG